MTSFYRYLRHAECIKRDERPRQPPPQNSTDLATETGNETSNMDMSSQNQVILQIVPLATLSDVSTSTISDHIDLTELFESDFIESSSSPEEHSV